MTRDEAAFFDELGELDLPSDQYVAVVNMNDVILGIEYAVDKCNGFASWDLGIFSSQVFMAVGLRFVNVGGQVQIIPGEPQLLIRNPAMLFPEGFLEGIASILDFFGIDANENDVRDYINRKAASYIQGPLAVRVLQLIRDELVDLL